MAPSTLAHSVVLAAVNASARLSDRILHPVEFILGTLGIIAFLVAVLLLIGHFYPGSGADLVDWKPTRSFEDEARLEEEDVAQMIDAQNEMRRRRGAPELTEKEIRNKVREDELHRLRGRGPFGGG